MLDSADASHETSLPRKDDVMPSNPTRRTFSKWLMTTSLLTACGRLLRRDAARPAAPTAPSSGLPVTLARRDYEVVVIGTGFGGTMTGLTLARHFKGRNRGERVLMLERGAWWTTPVETVQDKQIHTLEFLSVKQKQPTRVWVSADHLRGLADVFLRYIKRDAQPDGLFEVTQFGAARGLRSDGVTVFRANAVGGGSLVYANVTIEPPSSVFKTWGVSWDAPTDSGNGPKDRATWYDLARHAIGFGVHSAWEYWDKGRIPFTGKDFPTQPVNAGLSNIVTRSARLQPQWKLSPDPSHPGRILKQIDPQHSSPGDKMNDLWIDRARVFQTAAANVLAQRHQPADYGTVDSSINDLTSEGSPFGPDQPPHNYRPGETKTPTNYCERQGRCMLGCLPGARHTLNKQLMRALWGKPDGTKPPDFIGDDFLRLQAFAEVRSVAPLDGGGYAVTYQERDKDAPQRIVRTTTVTARAVVIAAGCIGTTELFLRSKQDGTLPALSDQVGAGFSINGDYLAFTGETRETVSLTRGPMTTSFAHVNAADVGGPTGPSTFHTIEDMGIPKPFSLLFGVGAQRLDEFTRTGLTPTLIGKIVIQQVVALGDKLRRLVGLMLGSPVAQDALQAEDIDGRKMMCYAAMGRDAADGRIRLGRKLLGETALRVERDSGQRFDQDPIYAEIHATLDLFSKELGAPSGRHDSPLRASRARSGEPPVLGVSHPLGGCRIAKDASGGVVDEFGRVFGYPGLYVADASMVPTSLGVNPSLTISALALRVADRMIRDHYTS